MQGLYSGAAAMDVLAKQQDRISENLSHLNTSGHRRSEFSVMERQLSPGAGADHKLGPQIDLKKIDFTQGRHEQTDRKLDVAISGDGFFVLEGPNGDLYTRNGRFMLSPDGQLLTETGLLVQGENGPLQLDSQNVSIGSDGSIRDGGREIGQLKIVTFEDNTTLVPKGDSMFEGGPNSQTIETQATVNQGYLEYSNAHPVSELISLIIGSRHYDAVQKASRTISESLREHIRA